MKRHAAQLWATLQEPIGRSEIDRRFQALKDSAKGAHQDGCFEVEWLRETVETIDRLYYKGLLLPMINRTYEDGLEVEIETGERQVAGYVMESPDRHRLILSMNRRLFHDLFLPDRKPRGDRGYHSGGLLCRSRLDCFLHVLLHETVHLALTVLERSDFREDARDHGKEFSGTVRRLFGQTDAQHGLIDGFEQARDLDDIRKHVRPRQRVEVFVNGGWSPAVVSKVGRKWVYLTLDRRAERLKVHLGLVRPLEGSSDSSQL